MALHPFLHTLSQHFALDAAQTRRLWRLSKLHAPPPDLAHWLRRGLGVLAALLLGAGLVFWVAANWQAQSRGFKLLLLQAAVALPLVAALLLSRWRTACLLLATLALGGLLAYVGQTYQTGADAWQLFATWAALSLTWVALGRRDALWALWLLIAGTGLGLWSAGRRGMLGWDASPGLLATLGDVLPWALLLLLPWALLRWQLVRSASVHLSTGLAALMAFGAWVGYGFSGLFGSALGWSYWLSLACTLAALVWLHGQYPRDLPSLGLGLLALNALGLGLVGRGLVDLGVGGIFFMLLMAAASLSSSGSWLLGLQRAQASATDHAGEA